MSKREPSGDAQATVHVSDGQGVLVGTGVTQVNNWVQRQAQDLGSLTDIDPHIAVVRLLRLTHDERVDYFAKASPGDVSELLGVFFEVDEAKSIATLGDINRRKAAELIENCFYEDVLKPLPEAAYRISRKAVGLRWTDAGPLESFGEKYARRYKNGRIFSDDRAGVHVTIGVIDDYATASGPRWGGPIGDEEPAPSSPFGTEGIRQGFQIGTVYSSKHGIYRVIEELCYGDEGGSYGWLGFPVGEIEQNPRTGNIQPFEGGLIYSGFGSRKVALAVRRDVADAMPSTWEIRPLTKETNITSSSGSIGRVQPFECFDWDAFNATAYSLDGHDVVPVAGEILPYYTRLGGEESWLGFPVSPVIWISKHASVQSFEAGMIYMKSGGPIAVSDAFAKLVPDGCAPHEVLGFPESEEQSIGESGRIQVFENGVLTLRDGNGEMWVRPQSDLAPVIYVDHRASEPGWTDFPSEPEDDGFVDD
jgi:hypothetical protein